MKDLDKVLNGCSVVDVAAIDEKARARVSGAVLRTFVNICNEWDLLEKERLLILGSISRSTYYSWVSKAENKVKFSLPLDVLLRISYVLGIYKAVSIVFYTKEQGLAWLNNNNKGLAFGGQSPKNIMLSGSQDGLAFVRRYLDAWRGGVFAAPDDSVIGEDDVVIIKRDKGDKEN